MIGAGYLYFVLLWPHFRRPCFSKTLYVTINGNAVIKAKQSREVADITEVIVDFQVDKRLTLSIGTADGPRFVELLGQRALTLEPLKSRQRHTLIAESAFLQIFERLAPGLNPPYIHGPEGEPLWPPGFRGSVTHSNDLAIVAVTSDPEISSVGIDLEYPRENTSLGIQKRVLVGSEVALLSEGGLPLSLRDLLIAFSAKESIYKAVYPLTKIKLGFKEVLLKGKNSSTLRFELLRQTAQLPMGYEFQVNFAESDGYILTWILIENPSSPPS